MSFSIRRSSHYPIWPLLRVMSLVAISSTWRHRFSALVRTWRSRLRGQAGMSTAEYAVGMIAAVGFAGVLLSVLSSDTVKAALAAIVERALK